MNKYYLVAIVVFAILFNWSGMPLRSADGSAKPGPLVKIDKELDKRTVIKKSLIPGSGNGLFAVVKIKKGEVIGHLGGRLLEEFPQGNHYVGALIECAQKEAHPYKYLDSKDQGANVSRINFAPSKINGIDTNFQNAGIKRLCKPPYFEFVALRTPGFSLITLMFVCPA